MMFRDEYAPFFDGQMTHALLDSALLIDIAFRTALAVSVSAGIHRIGQYVMNRGVSGNNPANLAIRPILQREGWSFRTQPKPDAASGAEFGKTFEDRANRSGDRFIRMEQDFTIGISPDETHGQTAPQLAARGFVANAAVQPGANDVEFRFAHGSFETEQQAIVEQCRMIDAIVISNQSVGQAA